MKKILMFVAMLCGAAVFAEIKVNGAINLQSGDLFVELRGSAAANIGLVKWKGVELTDRYSTSGSVICYAGKGNGFIGAGRKHKNQVEILNNLVIKADGKQIDWKTAKNLKAATFEIERTAKILDINFSHKIRITKDTILESISATPEKDVTLSCYDHLYSWNRKFNTFRAIFPNGGHNEGQLTVSNKFVVNGYRKALVLVDTADSITVVSSFIPARGVPSVLLWDRPSGITEYMRTGQGKVFSAGKAFTYQHKAFFCSTKDADAAVKAAGL